MNNIYDYDDFIEIQTLEGDGTNIERSQSSNNYHYDPFYSSLSELDQEKFYNVQLQGENNNYAHYYETLTKCKDFEFGADAVKRKGSLYLKDLDGFDYDTYLYGASFFPASSTYSQSILGKLNRRKPYINLPDSLRYLERRSTFYDGGLLTTLNTMVRHIVTYGMSVAMIDFREDYSEYETYINLYDPRSISRIVFNHITGGLELVKFTNGRFRETYLYLDGNGVYRSTTVEKIQSNSKNFSLRTNDQGYRILHSTPSYKSAASLDYIPIFFIKPSSDLLSNVKPIILDLVNLNQDNYIQNAEFFMSSYVTCRPKAVTSIPESSDGFDSLKTGAPVLISHGDPENALRYVGYNGNGLGYVRDSVNATKTDLLNVGSSILATSIQPESGRSRAIRMNDESCILQTVVTTVEDGINQVLDAICRITNNPTDENMEYIKYYRDFLNQPVDPQLLTTLTNMFSAGLISREAIQKLLEREDVVSSEDYYNMQQYNDQNNVTMVEPNLQEDINSSSGDSETSTEVREVNDQSTNRFSSLDFN